MNKEHKRTVVISNRLGMHTRAATLFVQLASSFQSEVFVTKDGQEVNGKSIMGILMLVAAQGTEIEVRCEGKDAETACTKLVELVDSKFGEDE